MKGDQAVANGTLAGAGRNGLPPRLNYVYGGSKRLADEPGTAECAGGCGRYIQQTPKVTGGLCAVCRESSALGGSADR